jgi:hypothetical protein
MFHEVARGCDEDELRHLDRMRAETSGARRKYPTTPET